MRKNNNVEIWLSISHGLFNDLLPAGAGPEVAGHGMSPVKLEALMARESERVTDAFIEMSRAKDQSEVHSVFRALAPDTVIALFSRWVHYQSAWTKMLKDRKPTLRVRPYDTWRAIFLELSGNKEAAAKASKWIWGEEF